MALSDIPQGPAQPSKAACPPGAIAHLAHLLESHGVLRRRSRRTSHRTSSCSATAPHAVLFDVRRVPVGHHPDERTLSACPPGTPQQGRRLKHDRGSDAHGGELARSSEIVTESTVALAAGPFRAENPLRAAR